MFLSQNLDEEFGCLGQSSKRCVLSCVKSKNNREYIRMGYVYIYQRSLALMSQ